MRKLAVTLSLCLLLWNAPALAAPPENELNTYLNEIGWTKAELLDYLSYYEIPLDDFATVEELQSVLGTPINASNLGELLITYELTQQELDELLGHFGDSLAQYKFIEDLDASVDFYLNHDTYMADLENELATIGITEAETEKLFTYLAEVEEKYVGQLDELGGIDARLEKFMTVSDTSELSDAELDELVDLMEESIALYEIKMTFKMGGKNVSLKELLRMKEAPDNLYIAVFSTAGELLIDYNIPKEYFVSGEVIEEGEEMVHVGELSNEFVDYMHDEKIELAEDNLK